MFLDNYFSQNTNIKKISKASTSFVAGYNFWLNYLFERAARLFKWGKLPSTIENHNMEITLLMNGTAGTTNEYKNKLYVYNGQYAGTPTVYYDKYEDYSVYSPLYSAVLKIDKNIAVGRNSSLGNSIYPLCHRYAMLLAHTDTSLTACLINGRDKTVGVASTNAQKIALENYRNGIANGSITGAILDPAFSGVEFVSVPNAGKDTVLDLIELRERLLNDFYNDIGVKNVKPKNEPLHTQAEVNGQDSMLLLNLNDMLECRKKFADDINKLYGTNITVDKSEELKYMEEYGRRWENENDKSQRIMENK